MIHILLLTVKILYYRLHCSIDQRNRKIDFELEPSRCSESGMPKRVVEEMESIRRTWSEIKVMATNPVRWRALIAALCSVKEWKDLLLVLLDPFADAPNYKDKDKPEQSLVGKGLLPPGRASSDRLTGWANPCELMFNLDSKTLKHYSFFMINL
mgnify:CR=1 FL=1